MWTPFTNYSTPASLSNAGITIRSQSPSFGHTSNKQQRWVPRSYRSADSSIDHNEIIFRKTRSILNKLTPEKFDRLCQEVINVGIDSKSILQGIVILIYEKAIDELRYSSLYANLCRRLHHEVRNFDAPPPGTPGYQAPKPNTFRRLLIAKLQDEFENRNKKLESFDSRESPLTTEEQEQRVRAKQHMLGNIKFIGELYRLGLLNEGIVHKCIKQLINKKKKGSVDDLAEDLECLCQIMMTCGRRLDHEKAKSLMNQYFDRLEVLQKRRGEFPARIRFMLQDVIDLRSAGWVPRNVHVNQAPKTLGQIRSDASEEYPKLLFDAQNVKFSSARSSGGQFHDHQSAAGLGFFPMSKKQQYGGISSPTSPPFMPPYNGEPMSPTGSSFDFFSAPPPQKNAAPVATIRPSAHPAMRRPLLPTYMNQHNVTQHNGQPMRFATQPYAPFYNGYGVPNHPARYPNPYVRPTAVQPRPPLNKSPVPAATTEEKATKQKQEKDLPPRFMKQKLDVNHSTEGVKQLSLGKISTKTEPKLTENNGSTKNSHSGAVASGGGSFSPKSSYRSAAGVKKSAIKRATADTFQPPYQHFLDKAQKSQPLRKSNSNPNMDKIKPKKVALNEKEVKEMVQKFLKEDLEKLEDRLKTVKLPRKYMSVVCEILMRFALDSSSDHERDTICRVLSGLVKDKQLTDDELQEALSAIYDKLPDLETEKPRIKSAMASLLCRVVAADLLSLADFARPLEGGQHFPLFLLVLQQMAKSKGQDWLASLFKDSKIDMISMMPEVSQNKVSMLEILDMKNLSFLFPLLHIGARLTAQLDKDSTPQVVYRWIKDNVTPELHSDPGFINILVTSCLHHATKKSSLASDVDATNPVSKESQEQEKQLLVKIKPVLQKFVHDSATLQLHALYAVQVFCHAAKFPKGLLLRLFDLFYHEDVIDEEVFLKWKEDVNDQYPGKGKSLFQVRAWLTWLEEADTEDDEEEA